jgi:virulence factor Mce-like protein
MTPLAKPVDSVLLRVVDAIRTLARHRLVVSCVGLALTAALAGGYILVSALQINPARSTMTVRVLLPESGGLLANQDVTVRGISVGRVHSVEPSGSGVVAVVKIDSTVKIPADAKARVSALSAAGEQYLEFRSDSADGRALTDGSTVDRENTSVPISLAKLLVDTDGLLAQLEPETLDAITDELRVSRQGPTKLATILDGGALLITTLHSVLPQTVSLIRSSRLVFTTLSDTNAGLMRTADNLDGILGGVDAMDGGFRTLVDNGTAPLTAVDNLFADNSATMVQLLGNLTTIAQLSYIRVPALKALFPTHRGSVLEAMASIFHDGGAWGMISPYPHYACDYNLPRRSPAIPDFPEPYLYTYCDNPDPSVLIRGARNAPRPPGDDTAIPPPGYDPLKTADPTPTGRFSIPLTYGGPAMPQEPPR